MQISDVGALLRSVCHRNLWTYIFSYFYCRSLSRRQRPLWLLGQSNFLRNKSRIVCRSFPSIKTSSLSFLQLLRCSRHQSHPIRCLVTVPQLKSDSASASLWNLPAEWGYVGKSMTCALLNLRRISRRCQHFHAGRACQMCPLGKSLLSAILSKIHSDDRKKCQINTSKTKINNAQMQMTAGWLENNGFFYLLFQFKVSLKC